MACRCTLGLNNGLSGGVQWMWSDVGTGLRTPFISTDGAVCARCSRFGCASRGAVSEHDDRRTPGLRSGERRSSSASLGPVARVTTGMQSGDIMARAGDCAQLGQCPRQHGGPNRIGTVRTCRRVAARRSKRASMHGAGRLSSAAHRPFAPLVMRLEVEPPQAAAKSALLTVAVRSSELAT